MPDSQKILKSGWRRVKFGDVVRLSKARSNDPIADGYDRYIGLEHIEPEDLRIKRWGNVADGVTFTSVFKPGQVLFGKRRAYQRKVAVADFAGVCSGDIYVFESKDPKELLPELLPFICQTEAFFQYAVGTSAGSLSPRTNWTSLADFEFALPTMIEQRRIVELLQSQGKVLQFFQDASLSANQLKRSMRDHLFSNGISSKSTEVANVPFLIPEAWAVVTLPSIVGGKYGLVDGPFGSNLKSEHYRSQGIPVIQSAFVAKGRYDRDAASYVFVDEDKFREVIRSSVSPGDIVMVKIGVNCGACARLPDNHPIGVLAGNCVKITTDESICKPQFLLHYLQWLRERKILERLIHSTQQRALSLASLKSLVIGLPPIDEQSEISSILDQCNNSIIGLEERVSAAHALLQNGREQLELMHVQ